MGSAVNLYNLVQGLQDERLAAALNIFMKRSSANDLSDLQEFVTNKQDITQFNLITVL